MSTNHLALVAMSGFRIREREMLALGMTLPGLAARAGAVAALPALGLLTLAGMTPPDWSVSYHEAGAVTDEPIQEIVRTRPKLVGISALTASILEAYALSARLRAEGIQTVIGGLHATSCPAEAQRHADAVVVGDGEPVWPQILEDAARGALRPLYRAEGPFDLAQSPIPRFDLLGVKDRPRYTLQTARGCPFACDFCGASRVLGPFREKPVANIERELDAILASGRRRPTIELADDNTFAGRRTPAPFLSALERRNIRYFTEADWRIGERSEVLGQLASSGCVQVLVGIESLIFRYPGMGAKRAPLTRVMDAIGRIQDSGVAVIGCFIVGGDGEDHESMQSLAEFILECPLADVQLTLATPFPGTALHERLKAQGRLLHDRPWSSYTLFDATFQPDRLSVNELESGFHNLIRMVFSTEPTARRNQIRRDIWARRCGAPYSGQAEEAAA
jgi:radical SAM superfamily enzyme YgiQ (UPF0313 family)